MWHYRQLYQRPVPHRSGEGLGVQPDWLIVRRDGLIEKVGPYESPPSEAAGRHSGRGLYRLDPIGGLIDTHVHYVQTETIASRGKQLLD